MDKEILDTNQIIDFIKEKIDSGAWKSGDKIWTESEFIDRLQVKRPALRQAIERLCNYSILKKIQGSGTYVREAKDLSINSLMILNNSPKDLLDILYFRLYFEDCIIEIFIKNKTKQDLENLEKYCDLMNQNRGNRDLYYKYDYKFHRVLATGTHNKIIVMISDIVFSILEKNQKFIQDLYVDLGISNDKAYDVHDMLLKYIKEEDFRIAKAVMYRHIYSAIEAIEQKDLAK